MSLKKIHDDQPKDFKFSDGNLKKADGVWPFLIKVFSVSNNSRVRSVNGFKIKFSWLTKSNR